MLLGVPSGDGLPSELLALLLGTGTARTSFKTTLFAAFFCCDLEKNRLVSQKFTCVKKIDKNHLKHVHTATKLLTVSMRELGEHDQIVILSDSTLAVWQVLKIGRTIDFAVVALDLIAFSLPSYLVVRTFSIDFRRVEHASMATLPVLSTLWEEQKKKAKT